MNKSRSQERPRLQEKLTAENICPDFPRWPESWQGDREDIPYGLGLIDEMRPFISHLIDSGLGKKTIRNHMNNLWLLGGEIIRWVNTYEEYAIPPAENLRRNVDEEGGPYCRHLNTEAEQRSFDSTCRKLHRFLCLKQEALLDEST
ncbi:MAG: hypothetical protein V1789_12825 [PVC group bacterium]